MKGIQVDRLYVAEEDGLFRVKDWIADTYGNSTHERRHLSFRNKRDAEAFVKAAKCAVIVEPLT